MGDGVCETWPTRNIYDGRTKDISYIRCLGCIQSFNISGYGGIVSILTHLEIALVNILFFIVTFTQRVALTDLPTVGWWVLNQPYLQPPYLQVET